MLQRNLLHRGPLIPSQTLPAPSYRGPVSPHQAIHQHIIHRCAALRLLTQPRATHLLLPYATSHAIGYAGESAHRIRSAIYNQSCFRSSAAASPSSSPFSPLPFSAAPPPGSDPLSALGVDTQCPEKRIFYRLISGMHASISAHISANYLLDEDAGLWGHNLADFK